MARCPHCNTFGHVGDLEQEYEDALAAARAEGEKIGLEKAIDWHELQATLYDGVNLNRAAKHHTRSAKALRALMEEQDD